MTLQANIKTESSVPSTSEFTMLNFPENDEGVNIQDPDLIESLIPDTQSAVDSAKPSSSVTALTRQRIFKIIVIGDSGVGKTCLTLRFCVGKFPEKVEATIGVDFREKNLDVGGENLKIQIWDTAGQERFRQSMVPHYYRNVHAVIFVYDVTKRSSFENLIGWIDECNANHLGPEVPRILVGTKCDNIDAHVVLTQEAQCFADRCCMPLFETSAKDDSASNHVESIFLTVAHKLKNSRPMMSHDAADSSSPHSHESYKNHDPLTLPCITNCVPSQKSSSKCFC